MHFSLRAQHLERLWGRYWGTKKPDYEGLKENVAGAQRVRRDGYKTGLEGLARAAR